MIKIKNRETKLDAVFRTPLSKKYWQLATKELSSIKILCIAALFVAIRIFVSGFYINIPINVGVQKIFVGFVVAAVGGMIYGPVVALLVGVAADLIGFFIAPNGGAFFIGYTITQAVGDFLYALFLYRSKLSIFKICIAKLSTSLVCNIFLNSLWIYIQGISSSDAKAFWVIFTSRIPKNLILFPFEVVLLVLLLSALCPIMYKSKIIPYKPMEKTIKII